MSDEAYKKIFSKNLNYFMELNDKTQTDLINDLGFNKSAVSTWCNGTRLPRMDKVEALAKYFKINRSDLIEEKNAENRHTLSLKDERDISRKLNKLMDDIRNQEDGPLYYNGEEMDETSLSLLENALRGAMEQLKIINKEKYSPTKNKK